MTTQQKVTTDGRTYSWIQFVGWCDTIQASSLTAGTRLIYNGGDCSVVVEVRQVSKCFVEIVERSERSGELFTRRRKAAYACAIPNRKAA